MKIEVAYKMCLNHINKYVCGTFLYATDDKYHANEHFLHIPITLKNI